MIYLPSEAQCGDTTESQGGSKDTSIINKPVPLRETITEVPVSLHHSSVSGLLEPALVPAELSVGGAVLGPGSNQLNGFSTNFDRQQAGCSPGTERDPFSLCVLTPTLGAGKRALSSMECEEQSPSKKSKMDQIHQPVVEPVASCDVQHALSFPDDNDDDDEVTSYISKQIGKVASFLRVDRLRRPRRMKPSVDSID